MVLAQRVGHKRRFAPGLLLSAVTFLAYSIYWNYRVHDEVFRQFELEKEGRDEGIVWLVFGIVFLPLFLAYAWVFAANVEYVRHRMRMPSGVTPGALTALLASAFGALAIALIAVAVGSSVDIADEAQARAFTIGVAAVAILALVTAFALAANAYRRLQRSINDVWDAYDARLGELTAPTSPPPPAMAPWALTPP